MACGRRCSERASFRHRRKSGAYIHCLGCQGRDLEAEAVMEKMRDFWDVPRNAAVYNALIGTHSKR